jgi:hypothetical protein
VGDPWGHHKPEGTKKDIENSHKHLSKKHKLELEVALPNEHFSMHQTENLDVLFHI